jgi:nicotinate-nucleotide adenylyltransferase
MGRLGIFGGTFDPPHLGHLILAAEACYQLNLERLLWVLTPDPPHKLNRIITPLPHRVDMLSAAIAGNSHFKFCPVDIDRPGPHYAVDTVRILTEQHPETAWVYLMGGDSLIDFHTWRNPVELVRMITILGVMVRVGVPVNLDDLDRKVPGAGAKVRIITAPLIDVSASDIRQRVMGGKSYRYFVPSDVYQIIHERGLYRLKE